MRERERERGKKKTFEKFGKIWNFGPKSGDIKKNSKIWVRFGKIENEN